jgi:ubiquinone/menaquinone biosynthesis C-methylase UbiE
VSYNEEERRIKEAYKRRQPKLLLYTWRNFDNIYAAFRKGVIWADALQRARIGEISSLAVLDVGCGTGGWLRTLIEWGASPSRLHGVDLLAPRIEKAIYMSPNGIDFRVSNGWPLPYENWSMDICAASTVFSSILDRKARAALAQEMARVTKAGGSILIFDYTVSHPRNPDTIGIGGREIKRLFHDLKLLKTYRLILAPPLLRRFPRSLLWLAYALEVFLPFLCTHRLYVLQK